MTLHRLKDYKYIDYPWWIITCLVLQARQAGTMLSHSDSHTHASQHCSGLIAFYLQ